MIGLTLSALLLAQLGAPPMTVGAPVELAPIFTGADVAADGDAFAVAWIEPRELGKHCVKWARHRLPLDKNTPAVELACGESIGGAPAVAAGPKATVVVWGEGSRLAGAAIKGGRPTPVFRVGANHVYNPDIGFDGTRFLVTWTDAHQTWLLALAADGQLIDEKPTLLLDRPELDQSSLACVTGSCLLLLRSFHGNSRTSVEGMVLAPGRAPGFATGLSGNPYSIAAVGAGDGRLLALLSDYGALWVVETARGELLARVQGGGERIEDVRGAAGPQGVLTAWTRRVEGEDLAVGLCFPPPAKDTRRPRSVALPHEHGPRVATTDGKNYLLLTHGRGDRFRLLARHVVLAVDAFTRPPDRRPPVTEGMVLQPDGKPAARASVRYELELRGGDLRGGEVGTNEAGAFVVQHPEPERFEPPFDVIGARAWAQRGAETSPIEPLAGPGKPLRLRPGAPLRLRLTDAKGRPTAATVRASTAVTEAHREESVSDGGVELTVPPGPTIVCATSGALAGFARRELSPGETAVIDVVLRPRSTLEVRVIDAKTELPLDDVQVRLSPGSCGADLADDGSGAVTSFPDVVAGEQLLSITRPDGTQVGKSLRVGGNGKQVVTFPLGSAK